LAKRKNKSDTLTITAANVGYEAQLWQMADALRGSMDAAEYKHVVLGLIFLKYISDAFDEHRTKLITEKVKGADPEDPDEYRAQSIFWVPPEARWSHLKAQARQPTVGQLVDDAMASIERDNPVLKGVLPKDYARPALDKTRLGQLIDFPNRYLIDDFPTHADRYVGNNDAPVDVNKIGITDEKSVAIGRQSHHGPSVEAQFVMIRIAKPDPVGEKSQNAHGNEDA